MAIFSVLPIAERATYILVVACAAYIRAHRSLRGIEYHTKVRHKSHGVAASDFHLFVDSVAAFSGGTRTGEITTISILCRVKVHMIINLEMRPNAI